MLHVVLRHLLSCNTIFQFAGSQDKVHSQVYDQNITPLIYLFVFKYFRICSAIPERSNQPGFRSRVRPWYNHDKGRTHIRSCRQSNTHNRRGTGQVQAGRDLCWIQWRKRLRGIITFIPCCCEKVGKVILILSTCKPNVKSCKTKSKFLQRFAECFEVLCV